MRKIIIFFVLLIACIAISACGLIGIEDISETQINEQNTTPSSETVSDRNEDTVLSEAVVSESDISTEKGSEDTEAVDPPENNESGENITDTSNGSQTEWAIHETESEAYETESGDETFASGTEPQEEMPSEAVTEETDEDQSGSQGGGSQGGSAPGGGGIRPPAAESDTEGETVGDPDDESDTSETENETEVKPSQTETEDWSMGAIPA